MLNKYSGLEMSPQEVADCISFVYVSDCDEAKIERIEAIRETGANMCHMIIQCSPNSADRSSAIRYLRLSVMQAIAAIVLEKK